MSVKAFPVKTHYLAWISFREIGDVCSVLKTSWFVLKWPDLYDLNNSDAGNEV